MAESELGIQISDLNTRIEPQSSIESKNSATLANSPSAERLEVGAPEKKLTLFALRLAVLEKAATGLGTLGFIWATVVLLGGFAITLGSTDFWFITIILLIEGARIFSRSHELEWQHQASWSITNIGINSFRAIKSGSHCIAKAVCRAMRKARSNNQRTTREAMQSRVWASSEVPLFPYAKWMFISRNVSKFLYWLQIASATACLVLSLSRLIAQDYGEIAKGDTDRRNRKSALNIFYSLALAEALLFLLEKAYWEWKIMFQKLLEEVNRECELGPYGMASVRRFFYDAYSKCVNGSIFDGVKMDMVSFGMELLASNARDEHLTGARILRKLATSTRFCDATLQKIGTNIAVMERVVEMLNWKNHEDEEIRLSAAEILSKLAGKKQNALRVAAIPGAMESISSLMQINRSSSTPGICDEIYEKGMVSKTEHLNHLGLLILKKLARDHDNCGKIGNIGGGGGGGGGLLPRIIDFTRGGERLLKGGGAAATQTQILTLTRSLQLLKMLAGTTGSMGKELRHQISEVVLTISNIRDILEYGDNFPALQHLGIDILKCLALEADASERIGATGGVLNHLFNILFKADTNTNERLNHVRNAAGEALAMLLLGSKTNCLRVLKLKVTGRLIEGLEDPLLRINAARILRNLCVYGGGTNCCCFDQLRSLVPAAATVLQGIWSEQEKLQEMMIGLAAQVFKFMTPEESTMMFRKAGIEECELADKLVQILAKHQYPSVKVPRMRRFVIELAIWMMRDNKTTSAVEVLRNLGMERRLECVMETTSELENFDVFSGTVGVNRCRQTMHSLLQTAIKLLADNPIED
ncbi:PREDICTED: uncharacterized protein LOC109169034 [Ipomoea nil]|uniref:uncharacterized protein LOC109169034 n=1 Tax=Ipomoea nil TaxID=35883 RepID=UPI000901C61E|nr:PREDICTED: uncharacterized protein LOC109169034 [Ipomoea nil]